MQGAHGGAAAVRTQAQQAVNGGASGGGSDSPRGPGPGPGRRSSQFKGVSWSEASIKWRAQCWNGTKVCAHAVNPSVLLFARLQDLPRAAAVHPQAMQLINSSGASMPFAPD